MRIVRVLQGSQMDPRKEPPELYRRDADTESTLGVRKLGLETPGVVATKSGYVCV